MRVLYRPYAFFGCTVCLFVRLAHESYVADILRIAAVVNERLQRASMMWMLVY